MKHSILPYVAKALFALAAACAIHPGWAQTPVGQTGSFTLTFSDEFTNGFDTSKWNDHIWHESASPVTNYTVENGSLKIWPQPLNGVFYNRDIDTDGKFYQTYGYFEIKAKLP